MLKYKNDIPPCNFQCYLRKANTWIWTQSSTDVKKKKTITDIAVCTPTEHPGATNIHKYKKLQYARSRIIQNYTAV
jgi:hypothetical protein